MLLFGACFSLSLSFKKSGQRLRRSDSVSRISMKMISAFWKSWRSLLSKLGVDDSICNESFDALELDNIPCRPIACHIIGQTLLQQIWLESKNALTPFILAILHSRSQLREIILLWIPKQATIPRHNFDSITHQVAVDYLQDSSIVVSFSKHSSLSYFDP